MTPRDDYDAPARYVDARDTRPAWKRVDWATTIALALCAGLPLSALAILIYVAIPR